MTTQLGSSPITADRSEFNDDLQRRLEFLVRILGSVNKVADRTKQGIFRHLCWLAQKYEISGEKFRERLVRAGLSGSRASELKIVFSVKERRESFLAGASWKNSLRLAREDWLEGKGIDPKSKAAANVIGALHRLGTVHFETSVPANDKSGETSKQVTVRLVLSPRWVMPCHYTPKVSVS